MQYIVTTQAMGPTSDLPIDRTVQVVLASAVTDILSPWDGVVSVGPHEVSATITMDAATGVDACTRSLRLLELSMKAVHLPLVWLRSAVLDEVSDADLAAAS